MNAKEMCQKLKDEKVSFWINKIIIGDGKFSNRPFVYGMSGKTELYSSHYSNSTHPSEDVIKILKEKGYKVEEFEQEFVIDVSYITKTVEKEKRFWIFKKKITVQEFDKYELLMKKLKWVEISACCGEE